MVSETQVLALRAFNRLYTKRAGVLDPYLSSDLSLTDVRVLYELAHAEDNTAVASEISRTLGIDNGYLSRILKRFESSGWITRSPNPRDQRQSLLSLTPKGMKAYAPLQAKSTAEATALLASLTPEDRLKLIASMNTIESLLSDATNGHTPKPATRVVVIRDLKPGDLGWVLQAHGEIYSSEWGLNSAFESLVAEVIAQCGRMDPARERGWIAEVDGKRAGSIFLMKGSGPTVAKIRLLLLTSEARGLGLGGRLVDECMAFAREKGYAKIELWTHSCLLAARKIYAKRGFELVKEEFSNQFGPELYGETWEMDLK